MSSGVVGARVSGTEGVAVVGDNVVGAADVGRRVGKDVGKAVGMVVVGRMITGVGVGRTGATGDAIGGSVGRTGATIKSK